MVEKTLSGFFLVFCVLFLYFATGLSFGTVSAPKTGFLPTIAGTLGTVLAAINFLAVLRKKSEEQETPVFYKKAVLFLAGLAAYVFLMPIIGYAVSTAAALLFLLKVTGTKGWIVPVSVSVVGAAFFYLVFFKLLGVMLP